MVKLWMANTIMSARSTIIMTLVMRSRLFLTPKEQTRNPMMTTMDVRRIMVTGSASMSPKAFSTPTESSPERSPVAEEMKYLIIQPATTV